MIRRAALVGALLLTGCSLRPCENTVTARGLSPDKRLEVVTFDRSCGATTGFSTQLSILEPGAEPDGPGNVAIFEGQDVATAAWLSATRLQIRSSAGARSFKREIVWGGVAIDYLAVEPR